MAILDGEGLDFSKGEAVVAELTDYEISWILLDLALCGHSPAGVSLDRSPRNILLNQIINLLPRPPINVYHLLKCCQWGIPQLLEECDRRIQQTNEPPLLPQQMLLPFFESEYLDNEILASILLVELRQWYQRDAARAGLSLADEMRSLHPAMILINLNEGIYLDSCLWQIDPQAVVAESRERYFRRCQEENLTSYYFPGLKF
jgi:hypothetical protein